MDEESCVPPGFRFHPTEEELVGYYLARKVASQKIDLEVIQEVDLYRIEPWEIQERCKDGHYDQEEQTEWYFFSYKDRKYPSGTRTNRATAAGFWKATGRDKPVVSKCKVIGMRKTLVFYKGRAPNGLKTDWIIHEYRLQSTENEPTQEEGWVVCRAFKKPSNTQRPDCNNFRQDNNNSTNYYGNVDYAKFGFSAVGDVQTYFQEGHGKYSLSSEVEVECKKAIMDQHLEIPQLECSPSLCSSNLSTRDNYEGNYGGSSIQINACAESNSCSGQFVDWKVLDKLLLSQSSTYYESSSSSSVPVHDAEGENYRGDHFNY